MELTGPACTEAMSGAEEAERRERAEGNAGGVRVERRVRPPVKKVGHFLCTKMLESMMRTNRPPFGVGASTSKETNHCPGMEG
jgi:hypothetical protein